MSTIRWLRRDLALKLLLLTGAEVPTEDWIEHNLMRWAISIGRNIQVSHRSTPLRSAPYDAVTYIDARSIRLGGKRPKEKRASIYVC